MPHATSYGLDWPFTRKPREKKPTASSRRRSHSHVDPPGPGPGGNVIAAQRGGIASRRD
jgi:hypothetical protein